MASRMFGVTNNRFTQLTTHGFRRSKAQSAFRVHSTLKRASVASLPAGLPANTLSLRKYPAMRGAVAVLVLVAVAAASAAVEASESALSTTGRRLLQTSADCSRSVPYCNACEASV